MTKKLLSVLLLLMGVVQGAMAQEKEAYAALSDDNTVLTFYYDTQKAERSGLSVGPFELDENGQPNTSWYPQSEIITTVVFDDFFADCTSFTSTAYWFYGCDYLTTIKGIKNLKTDNVKDMSCMFEHCWRLTSLDLSHFNTDNVKDMSYMFYGCSGLTSLDVSSFDTENVTYMGGMFSYCSGLMSLDLSGFKTDKVRDMSYMFSGCTSLKTIYVGPYWSTESVNSEYGSVMFDNCTQLVGGQGTAYDENHTDYTYARIDGGEATPGYFTEKKIPIAEAYAALSKDNTVLTFYYDTRKAELKGMSVGPIEWDWDTEEPSTGWYPQRETITTVMFDASFAECTSLTSTANWFYGCDYLTTIKGIENLKTDNVTDMSGMFEDCTSLTSLDVSGFNTEKVTDMSGMFLSCTSLTSLDVSNFDTRNVTDMSAMFYNCSRLTSLNVSGFNTAKVTNMDGMFSYCSGLTSLELSKFDTGNVTRMGAMFSGCSSLTSLGVSNFDTGNVTDMNYMFCDCWRLTSLDLSHFDTGNVTDMSYMFEYCSSLTSLDVSGFDTRNVKLMNYMFWGCSILTSLDVSNFDTGNVTSMYGMFDGCSHLTSLDLSNFDTGNVTDMSGMFGYCSALENIFSNDTWNCSSSNGMFSGCSKLPGFNSSNLNATYAKPVADGGYFTPKTEKANPVGDDYWWTYYTDVRNVKADENTTVYTATLSADGTQVELNEVTDKIVPSGQAVILKSTVGEPLLYTSTETGTGDFSNNNLRGTQREISKSDVAGTVYTLAAEANGLGFYRYTGDKLAARKAYLVIEGIGARYIGIDGSEATAITGVAAESAAVGTVYDLQGRRVSEPQKGLYIVNGKKIVKR